MEISPEPPRSIQIVKNTSKVKHVWHETRPDTVFSNQSRTLKQTLITFPTTPNPKPHIKSRPNTKSRPETAVMAMQYQIERLAGINGDYQPRSTIPGVRDSLKEDDLLSIPYSPITSRSDPTPYSAINPWSDSIPIQSPPAKQGRIFIINGIIYQPSPSFQKFMAKDETLYPSKVYFLEKLENMGGSFEVDLDVVSEIIKVPGWYERLDEQVLKKCMVEGTVIPPKLTIQKAAIIIQKIAKGWLCRRKYGDYKGKKKAIGKIINYLRKRIKDRKRLEEFQLGLERCQFEIGIVNEKFSHEWADRYHTRTIVVLCSKFNPGVLCYLLNPSVSIILLTPKISDTQRMFLKKLVNIHLNYATLVSTRRLVIIEIPIPSYLHPTTGLSKTVLLNPSVISKLKALVKTRNGYLHPLIGNKEDSRLAMVLDIPLFGCMGIPSGIVIDKDKVENGEKVSIHFDISPNLDIKYVGMTVELKSLDGIKGIVCPIKHRMEDSIRKEVGLVAHRLVKMAKMGVFSCELLVRNGWVGVVEIKSHWTPERDILMATKLASGPNYIEPIDFFGITDLGNAEDTKSSKLCSIILSDINVPDLNNLFMETLDAFCVNNGIIISKEGIGSMVIKQSEVHTTIISIDTSLEKCTERILRTLLVLKFGFIINSHQNMVGAAKMALLDNARQHDDQNTLEGIATAYSDCCHDIFENELIKEQVYVDRVNSNRVSLKSVKLINADYLSLDLKKFDSEYGRHKVEQRTPDKLKSLPPGQFSTEEYVSILELQEQKRYNSKKKAFI